MSSLPTSFHNQVIFNPHSFWNSYEKNVTFIGLLRLLVHSLKFIFVVAVSKTRSPHMPQADFKLMTSFPQPPEYRDCGLAPSHRISLFSLASSSHFIQMPLKAMLPPRGQLARPGGKSLSLFSYFCFVAVFYFGYCSGFFFLTWVCCYFRIHRHCPGMLSPPQCKGQPHHT